MNMHYDTLIEEIADYVAHTSIKSQEALETAQLCLQDTFACGLLALADIECRSHLGPFFPGTQVTSGSRVWGTAYVLDPIQAAYNMGVMNRWLDYNDTWLAAEWGHPSDNIAAILAVAEYQSYQKPVLMHDVWEAIVKAYEIQGILALENSLNARGFDHVLFVKIASAAVSAKLFGCSKEQIAAAVSLAFIDAGPLRTYRHYPNTGSRKSWAAGDAASRGVFLAWRAYQGEKGYLSALTVPKWGFQDVILRGEPLTLPQPLGSYVIENILFKVKYPAEFHAQTAVEAAIQLYSQLQGKISSIQKIKIETHASAIRIISKQGPLKNFADRDHCLQYMVAVALLKGGLTAGHYADNFALSHPEIDYLREKMAVVENPQFSLDYLDPNKRSIASTLTVYLEDQSTLGPVTVEYPLGHRKRRSEALPILQEKLEMALKATKAEHLLTYLFPSKDLDVRTFMSQLSLEK